MGIDVTLEKSIIFNPSHQRLVVTDAAKLPVVQRLDSLIVHSIFRRVKDNHHNDGNPLVYALKKTHGYRISRTEIIKLLPIFYSVLAKVLKNTRGIDAIVVIPSEHAVSRILGTRVSRMLKCPRYDYEVLQKLTVDSVLRSFELANVHEKHIKLVKSQLARLSMLDGSDVFKLKLVDVRVRHYFNPLSVNTTMRDQLVERRVLLIDDLLATGTTLRSAKNVLSQVGCEVISAICLLSSVNKLA